VLAFHGQHAFALGTVIALAESRLDLCWRWPSRLVATAEEDRLKRNRASPQNENPARGHWAGVSGTLMQGGLGELSEGSLGKHMGAPEAA